MELRHRLNWTPANAKKQEGFVARCLVLKRLKHPKGAPSQLPTYITTFSWLAPQQVTQTDAQLWGRWLAKFVKQFFYCAK